MCKPFEIISLENFIESRYGKKRGSKARMAKDNKISNQQLTNWLAQGCEVVVENDGSAYLQHKPKKIRNLIVPNLIEVDDE